MQLRASVQSRGDVESAVTRRITLYGFPAANNLLHRAFQAGKAREASVSDIAWFPTAERWVYLCTVMELSRHRAFMIRQTGRTVLYTRARLHSSLGYISPIGSVPPRGPEAA